MLHTPTLAEVLTIHKREGAKYLHQAFAGEVDVTLRDMNNGDVLKRVHQKNMATRILPDTLINGDQWGAGNFRVFLSNDSRTMNQYRTVFKSTYYDAMSVVASTLTPNVSSRTWTFVAIITTPTFGHVRNFWYVGINLYESETVVATYGRTIPNVIAATKLTSLLTQAYGTQVEVNYRLVFKRASDV